MLGELSCYYSKGLMRFIGNGVIINYDVNKWGGAVPLLLILSKGDTMVKLPM